jgi:hypothetical protein
MNVSAVDSSTSYLFLRSEGAVAREPRTRSEDLGVGKLVEVTVIDRSGPGRYDVRVNNQPHSAESTTALEPGSTVLAVVTGTGDQLELRTLAATEDPGLAQALAILAARHRVDLSAAAQRQILLCASDSDSPAATLRAGLYLKKLGLEVTTSSLEALVIAQQFPPTPAAASDRERTTYVVPQSATGTTQAIHLLGQIMEQALSAPDGSGGAAGSGANAGFGDGRHRGQLPRGESGKQDSADSGASMRGLSQDFLHVSDGGALQYRYATVPLLVGGRLMELDMALFQQRSPARDVGAPRRLVMSLNTSHLGCVRIVAQSNLSNLNITLESNSEHGVAVLSSAVSSMRERLAQLGWQVGPLRCALSAEVSPAGRDIVDHVLTSGALDRAV